MQESSNDHIYNRVKRDGIWYMVDVSHDDDMAEAKQDYNSILVPSSNAMNGDAICIYPVGEVFIPKIEYLEAMRAVDLDFPEFTFGELFKNSARVQID